MAASSYPPLSLSPFFPSSTNISSDDDIEYQEVLDITGDDKSLTDDSEYEVSKKDTSSLPIIFQVDTRNNGVSLCCDTDPMSEEHKRLRNGRFGSSEIGGSCGFVPSYDKDPDSKKNSPETYLKSKIASLSSAHGETKIMDSTQATNVAHGNTYEPISYLFFLTEVMSKLPVKHQFTKYPAAYHIPNPKKNPNFPHPEDSIYFGGSLDVEGEVFDVEIKNPISYQSFFYKYLSIFPSQYYAQVQHLMAIRNRSYMYLFATSYEQDTGIMLGWVLWEVKFDPIFFKNCLYLKAKLLIEQIKRRDPTVPSEIKWLNKGNVFENSDLWKVEIFPKHCKRVAFWKNTPILQVRIQARKDAEEAKKAGNKLK